MPPRALYVDPERRAELLAALRGGASRSVAAKQIGASLAAFLGWIDRDPGLARDVAAAEADASRDGAGAGAAVKDKASAAADRYQVIRDKAAALGPGPYGLLLYVDGILATKGFPPLSEWWRETLRLFYESGKRWLILLVGRGGGKSSSLVRVAVVEALFAPRKVPPGQLWIWPFLSVLKSDARRRLDEIEAILKAIGVDSTRSAPDGIPMLTCEDASGNTIAFVSIAATVAGVSGPSAIGVTCDEEAKWKDEATGANPARQVLASVRQMFRARPDIHGFRCSSAWAISGTHHEAVDDGDTDIHYVAKLGPLGLQLAREGFERAAAAEKDANKAEAIRAHAATLTEDDSRIPTFVANPTICPVFSRQEEPNITDWLREVASVATGSEGGSYFDGERITAATEAAYPDHGEGDCFAALDTGSKRNAFALAIVRRIWLPVAEVYVYIPLVLREWIPSPGRPLDLRLVVLPEAARMCAAHGCHAWITDAHAGDQVELVGADFGIATVYTSNDPYSEFYRDVRAGLNRGEVVLSGCAGAEEAARQLRQVRSAPGDNGRTRIIVPAEGDLHGDLGVALVRALGAAGCGKVEIDSATEPAIVGIPGRYAGCR